MTNLIEKSAPRLGFRLCEFLRTHLRSRASVGVLRAALIAAVVAGVMMPVHTQSASQAVSLEESVDCPLVNEKIDLAFIIDRSGSLDEKSQGQTYNIEIEGVRRALLDPGVIPRDGSIAVAVFTFGGNTELRRSFAEIRSAADAVAAAAAVEALKCSTGGICPQKGPNPESNCGAALLAADAHLNQNSRAGARRMFLVSSDGGFTDADFAAQVAEHLSQPPEDGAPASEINVILLGSEIDKAKADRIVFPKPTDSLPGATVVIQATGCNSAGAVSGCADLSAPQVKEFAEHVRSALRSRVTPLFLTVDTQADPEPGTPVGATLSLRQAIEAANLNKGATTITFGSGVTTIKPKQPLPALTAPEITICGCEAKNCNPATDDKKKCERLVTIDGSGIPRPMQPPADGLLIRSNRNVVRGLKIINFERAGVGIDSRCVSDNVAVNRIERNVFENNGQAGVCVVDPKQNADNAVVHNVGNTISMNDFTATGTPIDLGCDGPTANDLGDPDQGPNTLLNFPDKLDANVIAALDVNAAAGGVTLSGDLGQAGAGSLIEVFAINTFKTDPGGRLIDSVTFLASTTAGANGKFSVTGLSDSPTCGYTATATDLEGNTSELMSPCSGFGKTTVTDLSFTEVAAPNGSKKSGTITVGNIGCAPLTLQSYSVSRDRFGGVPNDVVHFSIEETAIKKRKSNVKLVPPITIEVGQTRSFTVTFDPSIPAVAGTKNPDAAHVLSASISSTLKFDDDGCSSSDRAVQLTALVSRDIKLINPGAPRSSPLVTLVRSGDIFTVTFSIFDSNLDVDRALYEFFDKAGAPISLDQPDPNLGAVVTAAGLITGQSFTVKQAFSNAKKNKNVASVLVTVFDKEGSKDSAFGSMNSASAGVSAQSALGARSTVLVLPVVKLDPGPNGIR